jgi:mannan endo-1,4-beta-mannosidase
MLMKLKFVYLTFAALLGSVGAADRYEAEDAIVDENSIQKVADASASGGYYIGMKEGQLSFKVTVSSTGFYTLWTSYSQPSDSNGKIQNLSINGVSKGQISFPFTSSFVYVKASSKVKLTAGVNTIGIIKSWGWVNIDYIELTPYEATPFSIANTLVTPNASENAKKMFSFIIENFQKKIISGVMTNTVMLNDGKYTPNTVEDQTELAWISTASGKTPALVGVDFLHATGLNSTSEWHKGYTNATLALAEDVYKRGGIPAYCWHWMDPGLAVEAFYTKSSGNTPYTEFNLNNAFIDSTTYSAFNTSSSEYTAIIRDMDVIAGYLETLAGKGVPVLWRPLHESSGKWFWWGFKGSGACKALYRLMFERFTNFHGLNNLIWVWTTDEAGDALNWYPGDNYVDIVGRDYYYYPREANHGSLVASFEKVKEIFGAKKIVALSENGSVPHPDSLVGDGAGWSYFMPWYGDYTMDGWAHDNTAADWNSIMNNNYVITLDKMPGWNNFIPARVMPKQRAIEGISINYRDGTLEIVSEDAKVNAVNLYSLRGAHIATLNQGSLSAGTHHFSLKNIVNGMYLVRLSTPTIQGITMKSVLVQNRRD